MDKKQWREFCRLRLANALAEDLAKSDRQIMFRLLSLSDYQLAKTIFCYVSRPPEVATMAIIKHALDAGKTVALPYVLPGGYMESRRIFDPEQLQQGLYGIPAPPRDAPLVYKADIDMVIAPCLSADLTGVRLGMGGGYYDYWLASGTQCKKITLCRELTLAYSLPRERTDVLMDMVITDSRILTFK